MCLFPALIAVGKMMSCGFCENYENESCRGKVVRTTAKCLAIVAFLEVGGGAALIATSKDDEEVFSRVVGGITAIAVGIITGVGACVMLGALRKIHLADSVKALDRTADKVEKQLPTIQQVVEGVSTQSRELALAGQQLERTSRETRSLVQQMQALGGELHELLNKASVNSNQAEKLYYDKVNLLLGMINNLASTSHNPMGSTPQELRNAQNAVNQQKMYLNSHQVKG